MCRFLLTTASPRNSPQFRFHRHREATVYTHPPTETSDKKTHRDYNTCRSLHETQSVPHVHTPVCMYTYIQCAGGGPLGTGEKTACRRGRRRVPLVDRDAGNEGGERGRRPKARRERCKETRGYPGALALVAPYPRNGGDAATVRSGARDRRQWGGGGVAWMGSLWRDVSAGLIDFFVWVYIGFFFWSRMG